MKIVNGLSGVPTTPDYDALRAALVAIQAATPTARAAAPDRSAEAALAALHELLTTSDTAVPHANALGHSFARRVPRQEDER